MNLHVITAVIAALGGLGTPRAVAWYLAMFGSERYRERAYRLLRRPPVESAGPSPGEPAFLLHGTPGHAEKAPGADLPSC